MSGVRKRKIGESEQHIMALLKRLHLEHSSELYERAPLVKKSAPSRSLPAAGRKRWRLSSIAEEEEQGAAKRCKIDSEMADSLFNNLWISDTKKKAEKEALASEEESDSVPGDTELPAITLVGVRSCARSLEQDFLSARLREQSLQVVLWTPPLSVETIVQNSLHTARAGDSFQNEQGDSEFMC